VPEGEVLVSDIHDVGARRVDVVTRAGRTRSGEPDPVHAVVIGVIEEATAALEASLRGRLGEADPVAGA
jgi:hypothetical protein